ncbi:hypothetical protein SAMN05216456_0767 [Devosia crocina]|uniref:Uncharacterized protein n=1 Tax=Devosia crocina TaxID=429728 RepID=A0A1I7N4B5_9HYPH|nr:hypothetical protein [Devosia crocina]SFV29494.1 hypothetical protein SAMN05216456_0767 [Devosia crocina]
MSKLFLSFEGASPHWLQHHLPWLAVLIVLFGLDRMGEAGEGTIELDG